MNFFSWIRKTKKKTSSGIPYDIILGNAISMEAFYEKGKVKITNLQKTIQSVSGSEVVYG